MIPTIRIRTINTALHLPSVLQMQLSLHDRASAMAFSILFRLPCSLCPLAWQFELKVHGSPFRFSGCFHGFECLFFCKTAWFFTWEETGEAFTTRALFYRPISSFLDRFLCFRLDLNASFCFLFALSLPLSALPERMCHPFLFLRPKRRRWLLFAFVSAPLTSHEVFTASFLPPR